MTFGVEAAGPLTDVAEARSLGGREARGLGVALVLPDGDVGLQLSDGVPLSLGHSGLVLAVLLARPRGEPQDRVLVVHGGHRGQRADGADAIGVGETEPQAEERSASTAFDEFVRTVGTAALEVQGQFGLEVGVAELAVNDGRDFVGAMDVLEVREINAVLGGVLRVDRQFIALEAAGLPQLVVVVRRTAAGEQVEDAGNVVLRVAALGVVPEVDDSVAFGGGPGTDPADPVRGLLVRDAGVAAFRAPLPSVEGASDVVAGHRATVAHVGAEVLAVRVENHQTTVLGAVGDEVVAEVPQRLDVADLDVGGPTDLEPPRRLHR